MTFAVLLWWHINVNQTETNYGILFDSILYLQIKKFSEICQLSLYDSSPKFQLKLGLLSLNEVYCVLPTRTTFFTFPQFSFYNNKLYNLKYKRLQLLHQVSTMYIYVQICTTIQGYKYAKMKDCCSLKTTFAVSLTFEERKSTFIVLKNLK